MKKLYVASFLLVVIFLLPANLLKAQSTWCSGNCLNLTNGGYVDAVQNAGYQNMTAITMQAWIYPTSWPTANSSFRTIIGKWAIGGSTDNSFILFLARTNTGQLIINGDIAIGGATYVVSPLATPIITLNAWNHVAVTWQSGDALRMYVNGALVAIGNTASGMLGNLTNRAVQMGTSSLTGEEGFKGYIDEVQVYDVALSQSEIAAYMNNVAYGAPFYNHIRGYWRFQNAPFNFVVNDATNNFNDLAILSGNATYENTLKPCGNPDFEPLNVAVQGSAYNSISLRWLCSYGYPITNSLEGNGALKYEIYRDGIYLTTLNAAFGWIDYTDNAIGTCSHDYYVKSVWVYPNGSYIVGPISNTVSGRTTDVHFTASDGAFTNKTVLAWDNLSSVATGGFEIKRNGQQIAVLTSPNATSYNDFDGTPGVRYTYELVPIASGQSFILCSDLGWIKENGRLSGYVRSPLNAPVPGVTVTATATVLGQPYTYTDTTDASGFYEIRNVYYDLEATYTLVPSKGTHQFAPASIDRTLDVLAFNAPQANFTDTSVFTISGSAYFPNPSGNPGCAAKEVKILVNGQDVGVVTNPSGHFTYTAQEEGSYTFTPVYPGHLFAPSTAALLVTDNVSNVNFEDTTTDILWLDLKGYCNTQISNSAEIHIEGWGNPGCYSRTIIIPGDSVDGIPIVLPAQEYSVQLYSINTVSANVANEIMTSFQNTGSSFRLVDMRKRDSIPVTIISAGEPFIDVDTLVMGNGQIVINYDTTIVYDTITEIQTPEHDVRFIYGGKLSIELIGIDRGCNNQVVLTQGNLYNTRVKVWRNYNFTGASPCPVDTGQVIIFDEVSDSSFHYYTLDTSFINYQVNPGPPNISGSGPHPYQKFISFYAETWDAVGIDTSFWAIVEGNRSLTPTFITKTPELPLFVLHDPPGDGSSSTLSQGTSLSYGYETGVEESTGSNTFVNISVGAEIPVPFTGIVFNAGGSLNLSMASSTTNTSNKSVNTTLTTLNSYSTSDNDNFIGEEADIVVGGSLNMIYGLSYIVKFDTLTCLADLDTALTWGANDFATTYSYTIGHIKNTLIPQLDFLIGYYNNRGSDSALIYQNYKNVWQQVVDKNHANILNSEYQENRSFSGGVTYSYSSSYENSNAMSISYQATIDQGLAAAINIGTEQNNVEFGTEVNFNWTTTTNKNSSVSNTKEIQYTLNDKDPGDFFSTDIRRDKVYGTPAFDVVAGTSSCPHEDGTQQRDLPEILVLNPNVQNVPINSQATLTVQMSNFGESLETRTYEVIVDASSNLEGAVVRLAGQVITQAPATFTIPAMSSIFATLGVEAGPVAIDYNHLKLVIYSPCDPDISDTAIFNVGFQSTCSDVTLFTPSDNWLVNDASDTLRITYGGYNVNDTALIQVGLQIRRPGLGWNTIPTSVGSRAQLQSYPQYYALDINTSNLTDGPYEIRAFADCATSGARSYSVPLSGVIDRTSVTLLGIPSPSDGVLNTGEEVSVTFSEDLDCPHFFNNANLIPYAVTLNRADNGDPVVFTYSCVNDKITFNISGATLNSLQNVLLTASVSGFYDVNGNVLQHPITWSFVVNNSLVFWQPSGVSGSVATGGISTLQGTLKNLTNASQGFTLSSVPSWLSPVGVPASIAQGASLNINFNVSGTGLNPGVYNDTVFANLTGLSVQQPLYIQLTVYANSPTWTVATQPDQMNIIANFSLTSASTPLSLDANDRIGVFYGNQCRGVANIQYTPAGNTYAAYITVYGNSDAQPQEVFEFRMWDASTATEYRAVETQAFVENAQVGQPLAPMILHAGGVVQRIPLTTGWNWVSTYVQPNNPDVNDVLKYTTPASGNIIKTDNSYAQYTNVGGSRWNGTLSQITWQRSYQVMVSAPSELQIIGQPLSDTVTIPVVSGWNWIGYPHSTIDSVKDYMSSFGAVTNDVLQSSTSFSAFAGGDWNGSLQVMQPGRGYKLKAGNAGSILITPRSTPNWNPDIFGNEFNMNVTAMVIANGQETIGNFIVGAFINGTCVGVSAPQLAGSSPRVFLTLHGDVADNGQSLQFLIYDYATDSIYTPTYTPLNFTTDGQQGTIESAYALNLAGPLAVNVVNEGRHALYQNIPNPFNGNTLIRFEIPQEEQVSIELFDYTGRLVKTLINERISAGTHLAEFNRQELAAGVYFYRMRAGNYVESRKIVIQ